MSTIQLKLIALIIMTIDHIGFFCPDIKYYYLFRAFGRIAAPIYIFLLIAGFTHTRSKKLYMLNIGAFSGVMLFLNLFFVKVLNFNNISIVIPGILLQFLISLIVLTLLESLKTDLLSIKLLKIQIIIILSIISLFLEYSIMVLSLSLFFYYSKKWNKFNLILGYIAISTILTILLFNSIQIYMIFSIFLICFFNENKEYKKPSNITKYVFYIYYPLHIYSLMLLSSF